MKSSLKAKIVELEGDLVPIYSELLSYGDGQVFGLATPRVLEVRM
jgi:hypothetical protein